MLGKLIKYDMKAMNRFLIIIHAFILAAAVLGRIFMTGRIDFDSEKLNQTLLTFTIILYTILVMAVSFGTMAVVVVRFYKNIFSDEGYLTNTLPVTRGQHLLSKTITGSIWCTVDLLVIYACIYILTAVPLVTDALREHQSEVLKELGIPDISAVTSLVVLLLFFSVIGGIGNTIMLYASVALGQLFGNHRVLGGVVAYFALTTVISIISSAVLGVTGILADTIAKVENDFNIYQYFMDLFKLTGIQTVVVSAVLYIITYVIMKKKMNLS